MIAILVNIDIGERGYRLFRLWLSAIYCSMIRLRHVGGIQGRADPKRGMLSVVYAGIEEEGGCKVTKGASAIGMDKSFRIVPDLRAEYE